MGPRTPEQEQAAWDKAVIECIAVGWWPVSRWRFQSPSGTVHDLSAADLSQLDRIEAEGHFLVNAL